jgi:PPM family protein phosphatase
MEVAGLQVVGLTNRGLERARNEDSYFASAESDLALLVVADGMGGHRAGNVASAIAVATAEQIWSELDRTKLPSVKKARELVNTLLSEANGSILTEAENEADRRGMGTTLTAALLCGNRLTIGHVGDSRAYKVVDGQISLLTRDHSLIGQMIEEGRLKPEDAENHPQKHVLTRALGVSKEIEIDITELEVDAGSTLLLCTDGLTNMVRDNEIITLYNEKTEPAALAEALIDLANSRGGFDNITVVIAFGIGGSQL